MVKAITLKSRLRRKDELTCILFTSQQWVCCMHGDQGFHHPFIVTLVFFLRQSLLLLRQASATLCNDVDLEVLVLLSTSPVTVMNHHTQLPPLLCGEFQSKVTVLSVARLPCWSGVGALD